MLMVFAALNGALAVALGAFGAHGLRNQVEASLIPVWETAAHYHLVHSVALLGVALLARVLHSSAAIQAGWLMAAGMLVFSGSLYLLVLSGQRMLGAITPLGGVALILGWLWLAWALYKAA
ncbi:DUF423 domain-containing protein [Isoalcanivorax beigongshangi]|uniref:DUF423 domain-containing protein n=1 Tax=Isoalcanivorax beigongshangi TaxID=3238810 RepID=A0ABV4ALD1_9GAMM